MLWRARVVATVALVLLVGSSGFSDAATTSSRSSTKRAPAPRRPTTTKKAAAKKSVTVSTGVVAIKGKTAAGWSIWSSGGLPTTQGGAFRAELQDGGYFSFGRNADTTFSPTGVLRVTMAPGTARWAAELSNTAGTPFGRAALELGELDSTGAATATLALRDLNPKALGFSRLYLYAIGTPGSARLHDVAFVEQPVGRCIAPVDSSKAVSTTGPPTTGATPPTTAASAVSAPASPVGSGLPGQPVLPPIGQPGAPGYGSVTVARPAGAPCSRSGRWRIMPLGDSLTGGSAAVEGYGDSYRKWLWQLLNQRGHTDIDFVGNLRGDDATFDGNHSGWGGFTAGPDNGGGGNLYVHIADFVAQPFALNESSGKDWVGFADPDIVLLNIGANDAEGDPVAVERRLTGLVEVITRRAPTARILLSSLPPSGGNFAIVGHVGVAAQKIAQASGGRVFYADVRNRMLAGDPDVGAAPFEITDWLGNGDSVHMSASGGRKFALAWLPAVEAALRAPRCA